MSDLHRDNNLIKTAEDNVVNNVNNKIMLFVSLEICLILIYSTFFLLRKKCATLQATFEQKPQIKINSFQNQKHGFLINA